MQLILYICPISSDHIQSCFVKLRLSIQPKSSHMTHTPVHSVLKKKKAFHNSNYFYLGIDMTNYPETRVSNLLCFKPIFT